MSQNSTRMYTQSQYIATHYEQFCETYRDFLVDTYYDYVKYIHSQINQFEFQLFFIIV